MPASGALRESAKAVLRGLGGRRLYGWLTAKYAWGKTWVNYALMRLSKRVGAWPHSLYIEGTNICNAECVFCAYPEMQRPKKVMPMELFRSVIDQYAAMGGDEVDITPIVGDPFVDGKLFERLDYVASKPSIRRFHFFTNAIGMRPALGEKLLAYGKRLKVFISFGGFDRETYHKVFGVDKFDAAAPNSRALIEAKVKAGSDLEIQINLRTPKDNNKGELWEYFLEMKRRGVIEMTWMGAYDSWAGHIKDEELRAVGLEPRPMPVKWGPCHRLLTSPTVLADGRVNACACRDAEASLVIGDLNKEKLADILRGPALRELLDQHSRGDYPEVCRRCTYYDSIYPYWYVGQPYHPDPSGPVGIEQ